MTGKQVLQLMAIIREFYPAYYRDKSPEGAQISARLWKELFAEDDGDQVLAAVKAFIATDTKGFPPSAGQVKARLAQLNAPDMPDEAQAWALVSRAIQRGSYHAAEAFEKLPPVVQKVVGSPSMLRTWAATDADTLQTVVASNFMRAYRGRARAAMERLALPADVRRLLERHGGTAALPAPPDPEGQKREALRRLAEAREAQQRAFLGEGCGDAVCRARDGKAKPPR